jgi:ABC-type Fe3+ transport system permease subunit
MLENQRNTAAIFAHTSSFLLPIVGPALVLVVTWRDQYARQHSSVALLFSFGATAVATAGSKLAGGGLIFFLVPLVSLIILAVLNINRVHRGAPPILLG